jgi:hydrogenase maturation protease
MAGWRAWYRVAAQGSQRAIIVDAAEQGLNPAGGSGYPWAVLNHAARHGGGSWHAAGLAALALGHALHVLPASLVVYAVQPERADFAPGLSEPLQAAVPMLCEQILADLLSPSA